MSAALARAMGGVRAFNLVVSNVPGPQQPFYLNGERLLEVYPAVPLNPASQGLSVGVLSYDGGVYAGLLADRDLRPPLPRPRQALRRRGGGAAGARAGLALAQHEVEQPGNRSSSSSRRSVVWRVRPRSSWSITPASRRTRKWWLAVDLATGRPKVPHGRPSGSAASVRTMLQADGIAQGGQDLRERGFGARDGHARSVRKIV